MGLNLKSEFVEATGKCTTAISATQSWKPSQESI